MLVDFHPNAEVIEAFGEWPVAMAAAQQLELNINYGSDLRVTFQCKVGYLVEIRSNSLLYNLQRGLSTSKTQQF